ncbi:unnamed protein product [Cylindrotheca closterium]|uniref:Uncharacterized protein n=1 Tax=Cylindrotheca closterium TaxID=2856 RepID=A0AAD2CQJ3_9STRA|nr:unnamed protein product [Cylindrotheca closterium]
MKRSRLISLGDDQLIEAEKRQKLSSTSMSNDDGSKKNTPRGGSKSYDGRLNLLSLVCNQQLSNNKNGKPRQGYAAKMPHKIPTYKTRNKTDAAAFAKSAERVLGIVAPAIISPSEDDSPDQHVRLADSEVPKKNVTNATFQTGQEGGKTKKQPFVWKGICRPVPLPPRLPMVPAGYIFPLARSPDSIRCIDP